MNRILRALFALLFFELGVILVLLPWLGIWENNYFLTRYAFLRHVLLHPSFRGAVSGLGLLDIALAAGMIRRPQDQSIAPRA